MEIYSSYSPSYMKLSAQNGLDLLTAANDPAELLKRGVPISTVRSLMFAVATGKTIACFAGADIPAEYMARRKIMDPSKKLEIQSHDR